MLNGPVISKCFAILIVIFLISIIPIIFWNIFATYFDLGSTNENYILNINDFYNRLLDAKNYKIIFKYLILNDKFLPSLLFFLISIFFIKDRDIIIFVSSVSLFYILFLFAVYLSTPLDLEWHLNSANRVIKPIALFIFILSIKNINKKFGNI